MLDSPDISARIYTDTAEVVSRALQLLRENSHHTDTDLRILHDLENVRAGLIREAAAWQGPPPVLRPSAADPVRHGNALAPMGYGAPDRC